MPHVIVKLYEGRSEEQKIRLSDQIVKDITAILNCNHGDVSVAIEDITAGKWVEKVYTPDILPNLEKLYQKPGYDPFK